jgi:hypothetical protein
MVAGGRGHAWWATMVRQGGRPGGPVSGGRASLVVFVLVAAGYATGSAAAWMLFHAAVAAVFYPPAGITLGARRRAAPSIR